MLKVRELTPELSLSQVYDSSILRIPDHDADPTPLEKYGRPQDIPTTA